MGDICVVGGIGFGFVVVKVIIEGYNGCIFFVFEEGMGFEFFIDLLCLIGEEVVLFEEVNKVVEEVEVIVCFEGVVDGEKCSV